MPGFINKIKKLLKLKKISRFSTKDENEFYRLLKESSDIDIFAFENNWPYILQATRNGRYKFCFKGSVVYFTLRFNKKSKSNFVVIVNFLGRNKKEAVLELCKILKINKINVLIKNINKKRT